MSVDKASGWISILTTLVLNFLAAPLAAQTSFTITDSVTSTQPIQVVETHIHVVDEGENIRRTVQVHVVDDDEEGTRLGSTDGWLDFKISVRGERLLLDQVERESRVIREVDRDQASLTVRVRDSSGTLAQQTFTWQNVRDIESGFVLDLSRPLSDPPVDEVQPPSDRFAEAPLAFPVNMYIDSALVRTQLRLRFDAAFNNSLPDRAEFFYGQCGCFGGSAPGPGTPAGPTFATEVDYQEVLLYAEHAVTDRLSGFIELPFRLLQPDGLSNIDEAAGLSDINAGFKYGLWDGGGEYLTFQFRVYTPTGDGDRGLGTAHASLEPALLYHRQISDRLSLYGEVRDWIPLSDSRLPSGEVFAGNVLRYGAGLSYDLVSTCDQRRLTPFVEFVGWSILDGFAFDGNLRRLQLLGLADPMANPVLSVGGDTIVNVKGGMRYSWNEHSVAVSYGRALTDHAWYEDIARVEYRIMF